MTRTLAPGLQSHLDSGSTTMVYCWKIIRGDGVVQGFTEHDLNLTFDGVTFKADAGIRGSRIQQTLNLAPII